jgi:hypothetical protein
MISYTVSYYNYSLNRIAVADLEAAECQGSELPLLPANILTDGRLVP